MDQISTCNQGRSSTVETDFSNGFDQETPASTSLCDSQASLLPIFHDEDTFRALIEHEQFLTGGGDGLVPAFEQTKAPISKRSEQLVFVPLIFTTSLPNLARQPQSSLLLRKRVGGDALMAIDAKPPCL